MRSGAVQLFYSYAHEDEILRKQLDGHLKVLVREGLIEPWYDRDIDAGAERQREIDARLEAADIILLLLSPDFIASDYCYGVEMAEALSRHLAGEARVIPILLRPCNWENIASLRDLQVLPKSEVPVTKWADRDEVLAEIAREIGSLARSTSYDRMATTATDVVEEHALSGIEIEKVQSHADTSSATALAKAMDNSSENRGGKSFGLTNLWQTVLTIPRKLHPSFTYWTRLLTTIMTTLCVDVLANSFGIHAWTPSPLFDLIKLHPTPAILLSSLFIILGIVAWIIAGTPRHQSPPHSVWESSALSQRLLISTVLSTTSFVVCFVLLATILLKPPWCPEVLCPLPQAVLNPHANSDGTLEIYPTVVQSATFVIPNNPASYTLANLPDKIAALPIDQKVESPYRVGFGIHSLQRGGYGMFINDISLIVDDTPPSPRPLNVWYRPPLDYPSEPFKVTYSGEPVGTSLNAIFVPRPGGQVQLVPGETDEIDMEVVSRVTIDLRFHIQVTYRITNQREIHILQLPGTFEIVFSNASNWHQYQLADGRLIPQ